MKKHVTLLSLFVFSLVLSAQENQAKPDFDYRVEQVAGWVFYSPARPVVQVTVANHKEAMSAVLHLDIVTDTYCPIATFSQKIALQKRDSTLVDFSFTLPNPGFYRCTLTEGDKLIRKFNIGYEPEAIVSLPDNQPDLKLFWEKAKEELAMVAPEYHLTLIPDSSNKARRLYLVTMKSLGGVEISGYYSVPVRKGQYPAVISYMGYGSKPWIPGGTPDYVEFVLSTRGQGLQESSNSYGNWIAYRLDDKDNYYYRGAFMDVIRAIDFVSSRPEVNPAYIFAEGGSQGGAFSLAAAALDKRLCAIAPAIPFLSDYPDFFKIVHWPADPVLMKQKELGMSDADLYKVLSYFDIKNLAGWIKCPVIMAVGLQDEVCPPHTNFSGYNRISANKEYYIYPLNGHNTPDNWWKTRMEFFEKQMKNKE